ncbi:aminoglycoside phosphotransferase family protein [Allokutzneria sp. A3M-2-11 16]|uniref:aminoglycoside phosphotransferase family protein n=1 Tax=Allokutzneria sp. A3M-2-11 16 TaxID=2962043 RepID=UPI0020B73AF2|nr:aminoglycoside phosphotransferase family protein [Allokutzneria sp. A3M-2-11 16]MCP3799687.1 aminoglycoside phosphotransferase family protein [Allokutzneria sp. A3M-2-11 16]
MHPGLEIAKTIARVGGHVLRERVTTARATGVADIPVSGKEITTEWLTTVLCAEHPGASVTAFRTEDVSSGTSTRWRITVTYNEIGRATDLPEVFFVKTTRGFKQRLTLSLAHVLDGEPNFFKHLRPQLGIEAARGFHGAADLASGRSISLMEDITATKGATFCTPKTPISRAEIEELLATMAHWHARYWDSDELSGHAWLKPPSGHFHNLDKLIGFAKRAEVGAQRARSVIPDSLISLQDKLYRGLERSLEIASEGPLTLLHGDSHIGNTYRTAEGRMGFTDWQIVMRGSWAYDFAYTVNSGLDIEDRRAWGRELLEFYLDRLSAAGAAAPDPDAAWLAYRQQAFFPYFVWLATIGHSAIQPKYQPDEVSRGIIERAATALVDLDGLAALEE